MNKTRCMSCGKELEYNGFGCATICGECNSKWLSSGTIDISSAYTRQKVSLATDCLICGEMIELTEIEESAVLCGGSFYKVCDKCKQAVMKMREQIKGE